MNHFLPDVTDVLTDPELGSQFFHIYRSSGRWESGRFHGVTQKIAAYGNIQPSTQEQVNQVPDGDRVNGMITVWSTVPVLLAGQREPNNLADEIQWNGNRYKAVALMPWTDYGFCVAVFARM